MQINFYPDKENVLTHRNGTLKKLLDFSAPLGVYY